MEESAEERESKGHAPGWGLSGYSWLWELQCLWKWMFFQETELQAGENWLLGPWGFPRLGQQVSGSPGDLKKGAWSRAVSSSTVSSLGRRRDGDGDDSSDRISGPLSVTVIG